MFISIIIAILLTAATLSFIYSGVMCFISELSLEDEETLNIMLAMQLAVALVCVLLWVVTLIVNKCCEGA